MKNLSLSALSLLALGACSDDGGTEPTGRFAIETVVSGLGDVADATLSPDGATVYYLTRGTDGGLFEQGAAGTRKLETFTAARALAVSPDGRTLFVADEGAIVTLRPDGSLGRTNVPGTGSAVMPRLAIGDEICGGNGKQVDCYPLAGGPAETVIENYETDVRGLVIAVGNDTYTTTGSGLFQAHFDEFPERLSPVVGTGPVALSLDETEVLVASAGAITIVARTGGATVETFDVRGASGGSRCLQRAPQADVYVFCSASAVYRLRLR